MVLRGSTDSILDDLERAVDDGVNTYKVGSFRILENCGLQVGIVSLNSSKPCLNQVLLEARH